MNPQDFPGNSKSPRAEADREKVEPVVTGEVISQKKSLGKRFRDVFIGGDSSSVFNYVIMEVLVPQAKDMIAEAVTQGFEKLIFGDSRPSSRGRSAPRPGGPTNYTSYNRYAVRGNNPVGRTARDPRPPASTQVQTQRLEDIILQTRVEADAVLDRMYNLLDKYEVVTVSDLHDLINWSSTHVDNKWGWTRLDGSDIRRVRNGYILVLPEVEPLN